jgi:hypothetical protein
LDCSWRIKPWISVDEVDHLFKLWGAKLGRDLTNGRYHRAGPAMRLSSLQLLDTADDRDAGPLLVAGLFSGAFLHTHSPMDLVESYHCLFRRFHLHG